MGAAQTALYFMGNAHQQMAQESDFKVEPILEVYGGRTKEF